MTVQNSRESLKEKENNNNLILIGYPGLTYFLLEFGMIGSEIMHFFF